jgi:hypothetical protein
MDKRYQVFVSSTYADLQQERQKVLQALMEMDCIPAGMELFPAADDEQWAFIKRIIDDCDYYILIIGGRYGSLSVQGISYTEMEFDYAISRGLKVLAFVHGSPGDLTVAKSDIDPDLRAKLAAFRAKVCADRLVKFWNNASELPGLVALSLQKTIKIYPAVGWMRANSSSNIELLADLNTLRKDNENLKKLLAEIQPAATEVDVPLAGMDDEFTIRFRWRDFSSNPYSGEVRRSWAEHFSALAPWLQGHPFEGVVDTKLAELLYRRVKDSDPTRTISLHVDQDDFQTFKIQLSALGLITATYEKSINGTAGIIWRLTRQGERLMIQLRTVKASTS